MSFLDRVKIGIGLAKEGHIKSALDIVINPGTYAGGLNYGDGGMWMFGDGASTEVPFNYVDKRSSLNAYLWCPPVSSIIQKKAQAFVNGKTWITNVSGKANGKESMSPQAVKIRRLLANPNPLQSGKQFEAQAYSLINLYGYCVILAMKPFGYGNEDADNLFILPNWFLDIYQSRELYFDKDVNPINKITFTYGGQIVELPLDNLIILKDITPALISPLFPSNRIEPLARPINNVIGAYDSRGIMIDKRGPTGVFTQEMNPMGNIPLPESEQKEFEDKFKKYGLRKGQVAVIMGNAALKWQKVGFDVKELGLFDEVKESGIAICNGLSFPPFLLGLSDTTYNNQKEASRGLYQETIIPDSESIYEQLNNAFNVYKYGIVISKDYSHVAALQEDRLANANVRKTLSVSAEKEFKNNVITLNDWRTIVDMEPLSNGFGDMFYYELIQLGWNFGNTGLQAGDTLPTTPPDVGGPNNG